MSSSVHTAVVRLLGTTIGVGGSFDGFGATIPLNFYGTVVPSGDSFHTVPYPGQINLGYPIVSTLPVLSAIPYWPQTLKRSEAVGAGYLEQDIAGVRAGEKVTVIGMSQGSQVAEIARADMAKDPNYVANAGNYDFVLLGDPYQPNGGILARFTAWSDLPVLGDLFPFGRPGPSDSPFKTTVYQNQYDGFADFPAYFNALAITNAVMGILFEHLLPGYVLESGAGSNAVSTTVGNTTYVTLPQRLPLLAPLRLAASLIGAQRLVDALDPILRVFVEMGYDRTADPSQVKEFSWSTPQEKIQEARAELPNAIAQSLAILRGAAYVPTVPVPEVAADEPATPVTEHPALPVDTSPEARAVRQAVVNLTGILTSATQSLAKLLRGLGGQAPSPAGTAADTGGGQVSAAAATESEPAPPAATTSTTVRSTTNAPARQRPARPDGHGVRRITADTSSGTAASPSSPTVKRGAGSRADAALAGEGPGRAGKPASGLGRPARHNAA
ncbi:MAG TPA: PE-PPE domain-containing protein [Mycobacterium sp.]|nr:PE-PPE domain-containing protein [Mycobacterium sp.]